MGNRFRLAVACASVLGVACQRPEAEDGVRVIFEPDAALNDAAHFFDFPFPSDFRLDEAGRLDWSGLPGPRDIEILEGFRRLVTDRRGAPLLPVAYFRFDAAVAPRPASDAPYPGHPGDAILVVDITENSPEYLRLRPAVARTLPRDVYTPEHVLAVAPRPGFVLRPNTTYGIVVLRKYGDASGTALGQHPLLLRLVRNEARTPREEALLQRHAPLWTALRARGVDPEAVAAATVLTTGAPVEETFALTEAVRERHPVVVENVRLAAAQTVPTDVFCELQAEVRQPQFQRGTPPYDTEGEWVIDGDGLPVKQREEIVPITLVLPKLPMPPGGYPLAYYVHGTGGLSTSVIDPNRNGSGRGMAFLHAPRGIAMASAAMPINKQRVPNGPATQYANLANPQVIRHNLRQGLTEARLLVDALASLRIPKSAVEACLGAHAPAGPVFFDPGIMMVTGQSMGGMYTSMLAALEPRFRAAIPTGAGGHFGHQMLINTVMGDARQLIGLVVKTDKLQDFFHPLMALASAGFEPADPLVFVPRVSNAPLPGHPARSVLQSSAPEDEFFPPPIYEALALGYGHPLVGEAAWPGLPEALALDGRAVLQEPVEENLVSDTGTTYTGGILSFPPTPGEGGHAIATQRDDLRFQMSCFFDAMVKRGRGRIVPRVSRPPTEPCDGL